jgi:hypothetical protein
MICNFAKYYYGDQMKQKEMGGACDMYRGEETYIQMGKPEEKRQLGRPRHIWKRNIRLYLK